MELLSQLGFSRVQVNVTPANGVHVDRTLLPDYARNLRHAVESVPQIEWIFLLNDETQGLWNLISADGDVPGNMSVLFHFSFMELMLTPIIQPPLSNPDVMCGYGGFGPESLYQVLGQIMETCAGKPVWVHMDSSLRGQAVFSMKIVWVCIEIGIRRGM